MKTLTLLLVIAAFFHKPITNGAAKIATFLFKPIDDLLNTFTMYKIMMFSLVAIASMSAVLAAIGMSSFTVVAIAVSLGLILTVCFLTNLLLAHIFAVPINLESSFISGMIIFLIFSPADSARGFIMLALASIIAMASKYILAINNKHIFNPAAIAAVIVPLLGFDGASWWVATPYLAPIVAICAVLIVRKIHRFSLFFSFFGAALVSIFLHNAGFISSYPDFVGEVLLSWPIFFFGGFMLTEPYTMPPTKRLQIIFGLIIGGLFGSQLSFGPFYSTPEMALVIGNLFAYAVSSKRRLVLTLKNVTKLSATNYEFAFSLPSNSKKFDFKPGQYLEWTLPLPNPITIFKNPILRAHFAKISTFTSSNTVLPDLRGNRRFFTIASSPTESELLLAAKIPTSKASFFKQKLLELKLGDTILAGQLAGDFTLPEKFVAAQEKNGKPANNLVFIAGGIGITPFRSMVAYLLDTATNKEIKTPHISLLYCSSDVSDFAYKDFFDQASKKINLTVHYIITKKELAPKNWTGQVGRITPEMLKSLVPDFECCTYYLSGPNNMVTAYKETLLGIGILPAHIKQDYFSGY